MKFDQFIQYRALNFKALVEGQTAGSAIDQHLEKEAAKGSPEIKTVCAPISVGLFNRLTHTLSLLDISKRTFIEAAIIEALDKADVIMAEVDIFENQDPPAEALAETDEKAKAA